MRNPPLQNLRELSDRLSTPQPTLIALLAAEAAAGREIPAAFRPNPRAPTYYNPRAFSHWFKTTQERRICNV